MNSRIKTRKIEIKIIRKGCALAERDGRNPGIAGAVWQAPLAGGAAGNARRKIVLKRKPGIKVR
ncbi:MAG: hypothetical protein AB9879_10530 [Methanothrix sp.]